MSLRTIARRYASALADVAIALGEERGIQEELNTWESMIASSNELRQVIDSPTITLDEKRRILTKLIERVRPRPTTANFIQVLLQNHRLGQLAAINQRFAQVLDERSGVVAATVTTARPMDGISQDTLQANLAALTGKKVRLSFETDEDLIGGLVTRIGSTIYDGSVRNQLQQARERLMGN
ncbi:MAG TPA: ATP synthase F1 subunit delta [Pyrinomonadaceae bacterium]